MDNCIFCKIVAGEMPGFKIYEDEHALAFLDIAPIRPGHTIVIIKKHYENMEDIPENDLFFLMKALKKVGKSIKDGLGVEGYNIFENNDPVAGQIVPHLHFHIIPRKTGDGLQLFEIWDQRKYNEGEAENVAEKINAAA